MKTSKQLFIDSVLIVSKEEKYWTLDDQDRMILSRADWLELRAMVDAFYETYGDEAIEAYNEQVRDLRRVESEREKVKNRQVSSSVALPRRGYIYLIHGLETSWYKIGQSVSPKVRVSQLGTQGPFRCKLLHCIPVANMDTAEQLLHNHFSDKRAQGEWFELNGDDIAMIRGMNADNIMALEMGANNG